MVFFGWSFRTKPRIRSNGLPEPNQNFKARRLVMRIMGGIVLSAAIVGSVPDPRLGPVFTLLVSAGVAMGIVGPIVFPGAFDWR